MALAHVVEDVKTMGELLSTGSIHYNCHKNKIKTNDDDCDDNDQN